MQCIIRENPIIDLLVWWSANLDNSLIYSSHKKCIKAYFFPDTKRKTTIISYLGYLFEWLDSNFIQVLSQSKSKGICNYQSSIQIKIEQFKNFGCKKRIFRLHASYNHILASLKWRDLFFCNEVNRSFHCDSRI